MKEIWKCIHEQLVGNGWILESHESGFSDYECNLIFFHLVGKSSSFSEEKGESDDEKTRKGERRSSRVRQVIQSLDHSCHLPQCSGYVGHHRLSLDCCGAIFLRLLLPFCYLDVLWPSDF